MITLSFSETWCYSFQNELIKLRIQVEIMSKLITDYNFPQDLKTMSLEDLELLSYSIRDFLIDNVSKTGGHLAPNLGVVELTIALHKIFDSPKDKIVWDVGHQSYVHKILTGRGEKLPTIRKFGGISGFPKTMESPHDAFDTGHSSTSISLAAGMAAARDIKGENNHVIAVIGDGSMTGGLAFEAINNLGTSHRDVIVILNDNGMSISPNIGGLSQHLRKLRLSKGYLRAKKALSNINKMPLIGEGLYSSLRNTKEHLKYALMSGGVIFEDFGFTYIGPIDGHNMSELLEVLEASKKIKGPILIHTITKKGKGYRNAENMPDKFHGIGPFNPYTGEILSISEETYSSVAGETILELAREDSRIVGISAAMCDATGLGKFSKEFPDRFFDVGIAEAHGVTFAAALAKEGMKPLVAIYSSFLQRGYDQILEDVCIQNLPVVFAVDRAGIVGADGETHHGMFDIGYLSGMPNMTVFTPANGTQLKEMLKEAFRLNSPVAIRYPRGGCSFDQYYNDKTPKNIRLSKGKDVEIWAVGKMLGTALEVKSLLEKKGLSCGIIDVQVVKPLDFALYNDKAKLYVTLEDGNIFNGFGEKFLAYAGGKSRKISISWPDEFIEHGDYTSLAKKYAMDADGITERICEELEKKA